MSAKRVTGRTEHMVPMRIHKDVVIAFLRQYPEDFRKVAPEYEGTVGQYIAALESLPGQWFVGGELQGEDFKP